MALTKYVAAGRIPDVSDAVEELMRSATQHLPPACMHNGNGFRARYHRTVERAMERLACDPLPQLPLDRGTTCP